MENNYPYNKLLLKVGFVGFELNGSDGIGDAYFRLLNNRLFSPNQTLDLIIFSVADPRPGIASSVYEIQEYRLYQSELGINLLQRIRSDPSPPNLLLNNFDDFTNLELNPDEIIDKHYRQIKSFHLACENSQEKPYKANLKLI